MGISRRRVIKRSLARRIKARRAIVRRSLGVRNIRSSIERFGSRSRYYRPLRRKMRGDEELQELLRAMHSMR